MSKHTETPWKANLGYVLAGKDCIAICDTDNASPERYAANAAHIVRCVNAHDALVAALEALLTGTTYETASGDEYFRDNDHVRDAIKQARAALTRAGQ